MIAKKMGKTDEEIEKIHLQALLHDVGKIGVPDGIINKEGKLTDDEYEKVKAHTTKGYEILSRITSHPEFAQIARLHHEKYDGKGYPDGLSGEQIPEVARIIAVADAYDAMTSKRSYRKQLPQEFVAGEIERCK